MDSSPSPEETWKTRGRRCWEGTEWVGGGAASAGAELGPGRAPLPSRSPQLTHAHGARIIQTFPGPSEEAGKGKGKGLLWLPLRHRGQEEASRLAPPPAEGRDGSSGLAPPTVP